jgi:hypothetical protein
LSLALLGARPTEVHAPPRQRQSMVPGSPAPRATHHLGRLRGRRRLERLPALDATTAHRRIVRRAAAALGAQVDQYLVALAARLRGHVDLYPAAKWICARPPPKHGERRR